LSFGRTEVTLSNTAEMGVISSKFSLLNQSLRNSNVNLYPDKFSDVVLYVVI
jgi:hypothetical protein